MIKSILSTAAVTLMASPVFALPYDDTVTFSASAACYELVGVKYPSEATDEQWKNYLKCIQVLNYFNTKYN